MLQQTVLAAATVLQGVEQKEANAINVVGE